MGRPGALAPTADERKRRGAWATPDALIDHALDVALDPVLAARSSPAGMRVLDPACGDGRFLLAAGRRIAQWFGCRLADVGACLVGVELDTTTARLARSSLPPGAEVIVGDALARSWTDSFDVVVGNPPYLNQLARATSRGGRSRWGGGPYADAAVAFLALSLAAARPDGGRVALVLPQSVLASRDASDVRAAALRAATLDSLWWSGTTVFDAEVITCIFGFVRGRRPDGLRRWVGPAFEPLTTVDVARLADLAARPTWSHLVADAAGIPTPRFGATDGTLGDRATATAGFREQFYGLAPFVVDAADEHDDDEDGDDRLGHRLAPLVTAGLLEPGRCAWGERPARFAGRQLRRPAVDLGALAANDRRLHRWVQARRVPKVVLATQTPVLEAAADPAGTWVPSVPVVSVEPDDPADVWPVAVVLSSPVASAWAAATYLGAGLGSAIKLSARQVRDLPWPSGDLRLAEEALRRGDVRRAADASTSAYGLDRADADAVVEWWSERLSGRRGRRLSPRQR